MVGETVWTETSVIGRGTQPLDFVRGGSGEMVQWRDIELGMGIAFAILVRPRNGVHRTKIGFL